MAQITYRVVSVYDPRFSRSVGQAQLEIIEDIDFSDSSQDWKSRIEGMQEQLHSLLGDTEYHDRLKDDIHNLEQRYLQMANILKIAHEEYEAMRELMVAQGLSTKMPSPPYDLESMLARLGDAKKLLPSVLDYDD